MGKENSNAAPKGGFKDDAGNDQTDAGPVEFQWISQPDGIFTLTNMAEPSAWAT